MQRLETCLLIAEADRVLSGIFVSSCDVLNKGFLKRIKLHLSLNTYGCVNMLDKVTQYILKMNKLS